jgi:hypothetical protein
VKNAQVYAGSQVPDYMAAHAGLAVGASRKSTPPGGAAACSAGARLVSRVNCSAEKGQVRLASRLCTAGTVSIHGKRLGNCVVLEIL